MQSVEKEGNLENWFLRRETSMHTYFFRMNNC